MDKEEIKKMVDAAVRDERQRCIDIVMEQYAYWREVPDDSPIVQFAVGASGACANIVCRIEGLLKKPMVRE